MIVQNIFTFGYLMKCFRTVVLREVIELKNLTTNYFINIILPSFIFKFKKANYIAQLQDTEHLELYRVLLKCVKILGS